VISVETSVPAAITLALVALAAALLLAAPAGAARFPTRLVGAFDKPTYVATPPEGRGQLFVVERRGVIRVLRNGKKLKRPFLDIRGTTMESVADQRGLFSMAFAPDYAQSRRFYVMYVHTGDIVVIDEFRRSKKSGWRAAPGTRRRVLTVGAGGDFHHGGQLQFGPDKMLYASTGVGDRPQRAQDLGDLHGKILRIDPRPAGPRPYTVPPGNPFAFTAGARPEIWAYGLRNPWRFSFDRSTGDMVIGDVGENRYEEVDFFAAGAAAGANFGYPDFEGRHPFLSSSPPDRYVAPVIEYPHGDGYCAVMGGYVVRDRSLRGLYGRYLYADNCKGVLRSAVLGASGASGDHTVQQFGGPVSFGEDNRGHIYVINSNRGVFRITPKPR
jgi:glucose/arabinose dehydrogenase